MSEVAGRKSETSFPKSYFDFQISDIRPQTSELKRFEGVESIGCLYSIPVLGLNFFNKQDAGNSNLFSSANFKPYRIYPKMKANHNSG